MLSQDQLFKLVYWLEDVLLPDPERQVDGRNWDGSPIRANYDEIKSLAAAVRRELKPVQPTATIFRRYPDGNVVALFPGLPANYSGSECVSYSTVGQHGAAHVPVVMNETLAASPDEYRDLLIELTQLGYVIDQRRCENAAMRHIRWMAAQEVQNGVKESDSDLP